MCNSLQVFLKINLLSVCELIDYHLCVIDYHNIVEANMAFFKQDNQLPQTHNRLYQIAIRRFLFVIEIIDYHDLKIHNKGYINEINDH